MSQTILSYREQERLKPYWKDLPDYQTEVMKHVGPQDTAYAALLWSEDMSLLQTFFSHMTTRVNPPQIIEYFSKIESKWNDHQVWIEVDGKRLEFIHVSKAEDVVTMQGLAWNMKILLFSGFASWRYHGVGSDSREARCYHQRLYGEIEPRADMTIGAQGSITRVNQAFKYLGIFPSTFPTITVRESAVYTNSSGYTAGVQLNRQIFPSQPINHVQNGTGFTVGTSVNNVPVPQVGTGETL